MLALIIAQAIAGSAPPAPPPAAAPSPDFPAFQAIAEYYIRDKSADPDSVKFRWDPRTFALADKRFAGVTYACGRMNARNRMGGLTGYQWFYIGEKADHSIFVLDIDDNTDPDNGFGRVTVESA